MLVQGDTLAAVSAAAVAAIALAIDAGTLTASVAALVCLVAVFVRAKRSPVEPPDYECSDAWYAREVGGSKLADVFYAHPTTDLGALRWNTDWQKRACTGPIAGDGDMLMGQAEAWRKHCNLWAPKYRQVAPPSRPTCMS